jgi:hypothetical protein
MPLRLVPCLLALHVLGRSDVYHYYFTVFESRKDCCSQIRLRKVILTSKFGTPTLCGGTLQDFKVCWDVLYVHVGNGLGK